MLEQLIPFLTASILLTFSPGPDIIYVLVRSIANGAREGIVTALGLVSGILIHTSLVAFGVSAIIKQSDNIFLFIKILGAIYLLYLAWQVYKSDPDIAFSSEGIRDKNLSSLFRQGFIMNVLNPKVGIFFLAFFPGFLWEPEGNTILQFYILGFVFMLQALLIFSLVAVLANKISVYIKSHPGSGMFLKWMQVVIFILIAVLILL
ncbi:threonine/homoserine/homoserine lactone efflux protein [Christiangramia gaetbulicola]|uniref:Threonine/homoserine/homoserine lactone efflux protein n=1 Tax=Christiangramia gaetbulicola TaxID=703340 RepID=A0A2T6AEN1_9FLAO|nr:LysE family translocator [Christiangramia gaetbulicola]PTX42226.1 threonine/homoserine/homoserine lactone efflux protein [Christiangramia gaetbulicola]